MTKIDCRGVNMYRGYTIKELTDTLDVTAKTVQRWMEKGLRTVPGCKNPILILGSDLKEFIKSKDSKRKVKLKRNEFYCMKCKAARLAKRGSIQTLNGKKVGVCRVCSGKMVRIIKPYQKGLFDTRT